MARPPVIEPMLATSGCPADATPGRWDCELKVDGWRAVVTLDATLPVGYELRTRSGRVITDLVPQLAPLAELGIRAVLDCELAALDDNGRVDFARLGARMALAPAKAALDHTTLMLAAFDVLWLDGTITTTETCANRRKLLEDLRFGGPMWCTVPRWPAEDLDAVLDACEQLGHEGVVLKRRDSRYLPGRRSTGWRKVKTAAWRQRHGGRVRHR